MGRRPNFLVQQFFERGDKRNDTSNRYEFTCRRCGEHDSKGRPEQLLTHVLVQCPNATQHDRDIIEFYHNPSEEQRGKRPPALFPVSSVVSGVVSDKHHRHALQTASRDADQTALDTLAEVSRQQLGTQRRYPQEQRPAYDQDDHDDNDRFEDPSPSWEIQPPAAVDEPQDTLSAWLSHAQTSSNTARQGRVPASNSRSTYGGLDDGAFVPMQPGMYEVPTTLHHGRFDPVPSNGSLNSHLTPHAFEQRPALRFAAPPRQFQPLVAPPASTPAHGTPSNHDFSPVNSGPSPPAQSSPGATIVNDEDDENDAPAEPDWNNFRGFVHRNEATQRNEPDGSQSYSRRRGKFTAERRKEVFDLRKKGACLRCRMLKKSCSEETPCTGCAAVDSGYLWSGNCIRIRLADAFSLWASNLFHSWSRIEVPAAVQGFAQLPLTGRMEARFFPDSEKCFSFAAKQYSQDSAVTARQTPSRMDDEGESVNMWLVNEGEDMMEKVSHYILATARESIESEQSQFLRATLRQAQALAQTVERDMPTANPSARSSYTLQSHMLEAVIELWVATRLLCLPEQRQLELQHNLTMPPRRLAEGAKWDAPSGSGITHVPAEAHGHSLVLKQLLAVIESRCAKLGKSILSEIERRFLQRQQVSRFATFIIVVILLNCVERMSGLYRGFDSEESQRSWPLDTPPSALWPQGEQFADLLVMLLRMRGLPPQTVPREDGTLGVVAPEDWRCDLYKSSEYAAAAGAWLNPLGLNVNEMIDRVHGDTPGPQAGAAAWDLRFVGKALIPNGSRGGGRRFGGQGAMART